MSETKRAAELLRASAENDAMLRWNPDQVEIKKLAASLLDQISGDPLAQMGHNRPGERALESGQYAGLAAAIHKAVGPATLEGLGLSNRHQVQVIVRVRQSIKDAIEVADSIAASSAASTPASQGHPAGTTDIAYRLARHLLNPGNLPPTRWGVLGCNLLSDLRSIDPERYDQAMNHDEPQEQAPHAVGKPATRAKSLEP